MRDLEAAAEGTSTGLTVAPVSRADETDPSAEGCSVGKADESAFDEANETVGAIDDGEADSPIKTPPPPGIDGKEDSTGSSDDGADLMGVPVAIADDPG